MNVARYLNKLNRYELYAHKSLVEGLIREREREDFGEWCFKIDKSRTPLKLVEFVGGYIYKLSSECGEYTFSGNRTNLEEMLEKLN